MQAIYEYYLWYIKIYIYHFILYFLQVLLSLYDFLSVLWIIFFSFCSFLPIPQ